MFIGDINIGDHKDEIMEIVFRACNDGVLTVTVFFDGKRIDDFIYYY